MGDSVLTYLINQTPGKLLVRALGTRADILLLITNEFSTQGLRPYGPSFSGNKSFKIFALITAKTYILP